MFTFFHRRPKKADLSWLQVDMHSHILPGIDDGCVSVEQSLHLLERLHALGFSNFHFTPHVFSEMYPNDLSSIAGAYSLLKDKVSGDIKTAYAAEYMLDASFEKLLHNPTDVLVLPHKHILVEMSYMHESLLVEDLIFQLTVQGYKPILAHPERYVYYHGDVGKLKRFKESGLLMQVNILSLLGYYGSKERQVARWLADQGWIDLLGTDVHHERHVNAIEKGLEHENIIKALRKCTIKNEALFAL